MSAMKRIIEKAEIAMMGYVVDINSYEEADLIATCIYQKMYGRDKEFDFKARVNKYNGSKHENKIVGLAVSYACDMVIVNCILKNDSKGDYKIVPFSRTIDDEDGSYAYSFCWAENLDVDYFSELGDVFFIKENDEYRIAPSIY